MSRNPFGDDESAWPPSAPAPLGTPPSNQRRPASAPTGNATSEPLSSPFGVGSHLGPGTTTTRGAAPFGSGTQRHVDSDSAASGPPTKWLVAAALAALLGGILGLSASGRPVLSAAGWLLAGMVAIGLVALFTLSDLKRRTSIWYAEQASTAIIRNVVVGLAILAVAVNAWQFADWAARR